MVPYEMIIREIHSHLDKNLQGNALSKAIMRRKLRRYILRGIIRGENIAKKIFPFARNMNLNILDFGSGYGLVALGISNILHGRINGIEIDNSSFMVAKNWLKKSSISNIVFENRDVRELNEKFDLIIANDVLEHVPDRARYLKILRDKLKAGGYLYVMTTNRLCLYNFLSDNHFKLPFISILGKNMRNKIITFLFKREIDTYDYSFKWELENLFKECGFYVNKDFRPWNHFLRAHEYLVQSRN